MRTEDTVARKYMKFSQNKNSSKKVYAFYLAVAFFFTVFSFGKIADASTTFYTQTSGAGGLTSSPNIFWYPTALGEATHMKVYFDPLEIGVKACALTQYGNGSGLYTGGKDCKNRSTVVCNCSRDERSCGAS